MSAVLGLVVLIAGGSVATPPPASFLDDVLPPSLPGDFTLAVTGDFIPARAFNAYVTDDGDFDRPLGEIAPLLEAADVTLVDLEAPLFDACARTFEGMMFCGDPRFAAALKGAGVDVVDLANNHTENHGTAGLVETVGHVEREGLVVTGLGDPAFVDVKGWRVAFVGFNAVSIGYVPRAAWLETVASARAVADVVVVEVHWGKEYETAPSPTENHGAPDDPRALARLFVRAGADLVVGNHPHTIQGMEIVSEVPVVYAHGNLLFDQTGARATTESVIGLYRFRGGHVIDVAFVPVHQEDFVARPLVGPEARATLARLKARTAEIQHIAH